MSKPSTRRLRFEEIPATPWKNGGGVTREIAAGAAPETGAGWGWRVSVAEVAADGPFSLFPGVARVIAVIAGAGMDLEAPEGPVLALDPFRPVAFSGDDALTGRLRAGPVRDLNVMVLRRHFAATMDILQGPQETAWQSADGGCLLVHLLQGRCSVTVDGGKAETLALSETLLHEAAGTVALDLADGSRAAVIRITRS